ncbi:acyltransferase family protein [Streptomyces sp. B6B3]|uniref:acyltransferase family protein n=1 Tax=Streptomyces sp. B6B3 TaxID=3153570 RepID=UPI00325F8674
MLERLRKRRAATARRGTSRNPHWDNIRFLSGTLVLFVHMTNELSRLELFHWLYMSTWAMRVPAFVIVAGYFSRADALTNREARRLIESILVPYLLIGLLHTAQMGRAPDGEFRFHIVEPAWGMWFLLSLMCWRMALPYLARLRYPMATSVLVALVAGYVSDFGTAGSLSRTLSFLPFFLLGWKLRQGLFARELRAAWTKPAAVGVLATTFLVMAYAHLDISANWLRMKGPYEGGAPWQDPFAWTIRGAVLLGGMVVALSFVRLVPRRRLPVITYLGAGGLYIYLLHPLVLRPLQDRGALDWIDSNLDQVAMLGLAFVLATVLASPPVRWLARPLVQPRLPWLFRAEPAPPAGPDRPGEGQRTRVTDSQIPIAPSTVLPDPGEAPALAGPRS